MKKASPVLIYSFRFYFNTIGRVFQQIAAKQLIRLFSSPVNRIVRVKENEILQLANKEEIEVEGSRVNVYLWGEEGSIVMLFHGWQSNAGSLGAFVNPLLEKGFRVLAFDAPAHGKSGGKRANLIYFKKTAEKLLDQYGLPEIVIGHSLGANTIIVSAYEQQIAFNKVILISPLNRLMSVFEEMRALLWIPNSLFRRFVDSFGEWAGYPFWDFYFHDFAKKSPLKEVLILHDINDRVTSFSHAKEMKEKWQVPTLKGIEGSGHYKILWDSKVLGYVLDFID